jgi:hypothetical protein
MTFMAVPAGGTRAAGRVRRADGTGRSRSGPKGRAAGQVTGTREWLLIGGVCARILRCGRNPRDFAEDVL